MCYLGGTMGPVAILDSSRVPLEGPNFQIGAPIMPATYVTWPVLETLSDDFLLGSNQKHTLSIE